MLCRSSTVGLLESVRIKYVVGPTLPWYQEFLRFYFLTVEDSVDGSLSRRFSVLILLLCLFGLIVLLLRRGRLPGTSSGPVWRLAGTTAVGLLLLTLTPTKWAVQFGGFAGLAGALGGVAGVRVRSGRRQQPTEPGAVRHRTAVRAGLVDCGDQRMVLRRQLRSPMVRQAAGHLLERGSRGVRAAADRDRIAGAGGSVASTRAGIAAADRRAAGKEGSAWPCLRWRTSGAASAAWWPSTG